MDQYPDIFQTLNRLSAQIGTKRAAAATGDSGARAWVAGLDHWLQLSRTGTPAAQLTITHEILPFVMEHGAIDEFEAGYHFAAGFGVAGLTRSNPGH